MAPSAGISATGDIAVGVATDYEYAATEVGHGEVGTEIGEHAAKTVERLPHEFRPTGFVPRRRRLMAHDDYGEFRGMGGDGIGYLPHDTAERTCCGKLAMIKMQRLAAIGIGAHCRPQVEGADTCLPLSGDAILLRLRYRPAEDGVCRHETVARCGVMSARDEEAADACVGGKACHPVGGTGCEREQKKK